ncbi:transglutaminase-like domain-containing protein [Psychromonas antarctica]|uniref:transglutaminase-like domain-containing protein n=1 Tax=Psychromonas antarctica TaxID=67573 RepID=UPI001EE8A46E|nr:transglutaminase family protein [Psychromonas antarctica]MCG6199715.1 transglutaminase family protein [Psychromonas antarctica]
MYFVKISSELIYTIDSAASFVFNIAAANTDHQQTVEENLTISPSIDSEWCPLNDFGCRGLRLKVEPCELSIRYSATVLLSPEIEQIRYLNEVEHKRLPTSVLPFLNPSRYCESDRLGRFAWKEFGQLQRGYSRVNEICNWVNAHIDYVAGSTDTSSSACDVLIQRAGVCRDFAHVSIALCRALGIPARYVSGYAVGLEPPDFHGFFEVYLEDRWYLFDATRMAPVSGLVRIGIGRDAADTSFANIVGQATMQFIKVEATSADSNLLYNNGAPVSTA